MIDTGAGFVALPNDYFDWLLLQSTVLTKRELAVLLAVIRNTIGYNRFTSRMSCRFIQKSTGIKASHVQETLTTLESKGYILIDKTSNTSAVTLILPKQEKNGKPFPIREQLGGEPFPIRGRRHAATSSQLVRSWRDTGHTLQTRKGCQGGWGRPHRLPHQDS